VEVAGSQAGDASVLRGDDCDVKCIFSAFSVFEEFRITYAFSENVIE
jgi:hypothetical protein